MDGRTLRDGIFSLSTRRFGSIAEYLVKRLEKCGKGQNQFHDLFDSLHNKRVEVKFSVVRKKCETTVSEDTVAECIEEAAKATSEKRMVKFSEWQQQQFDCNIQQVKRALFDVLYYGLFFSDVILVFRIQSSDIKEDRFGGIIHYSDFQHKGNQGEGQFHLNQDTLQTHLDNYLYQTVTYEQLCDLLEL